LYQVWLFTEELDCYQKLIRPDNRKKAIETKIHNPIQYDRRRRVHKSDLRDTRQ